VLNKVYEEKVEENSGSQYIFVRTSNAQSVWLQEKWNYFIIQYSRVPKYLRKNFNKRLLSTLHIARN